MTRASTFFALAVAVLSTACASSQAAPESAPSPEADPGPMIHPEAPGAAALFTETQAERGRLEFRTVCSECHYSSEFRDAQFKFAWKRRSVWDLYREIVRTMPEDDPGGLEEQVYLDVVSYILSINDFQAGSDELIADEARLDAVSMALPSGGD